MRAYHWRFTAKLLQGSQKTVRIIAQVAIVSVRLALLDSMPTASMLERSNQVEDKSRSLSKYDLGKVLSHPLLLV